MPDYAGLVKAMKQTALEAVDAKKPVAVSFGTVKNVSPLEIDVEQRMTVYAEQLILTKAVLDHHVDIEVRHATEQRGGGSGDPAYESHDHDYRGRKKIMIYNGLQTGEKVLLLRLQEGQKFVVWDRVCDHTAEGEWLQ